MTEAIPIIMISALGTERDQTAGLQVGADDYVVKPFGLSELMARIQAQLRRTQRQPVRPHPRQAGTVILEDEQTIALFRSQRILLSGLEATMLRRLAKTPGRVVTKEELITLAWGKDGLIHEHELQRQIESLRRKLGDDPAEPRIILTSLSGYVFAAVKEQGL